MKGPLQRPAYGKRPAERFPASSTKTGMRSDKSGLPLDPLPQNCGSLAGGKLAVTTSASAHLPQVSGQSRIVRERDDRITLEDKIRRAVDSRTAEECATAYWYLYAYGMTLERAKSSRHKAEFGT